MGQEYRAIIQLGENDTQKHDRALRNAQTLLDELTPHVEIEILLHNQAVQLVTLDHQDRAGEMRRLHERGVRFAACERAMQALGLTQAMMQNFVQIVPSATGELVKKQADGWAYVKI